VVGKAELRDLALRAPYGSNLNTKAARRAEFLEELCEPSKAPTSDEARAEASSPRRAGPPRGQTNVRRVG